MRNVLEVEGSAQVGEVMEIGDDATIAGVENCLKTRMAKSWETR